MRLFSYITVGRILEELKQEFQEDIRKRLAEEISKDTKHRLQSLLDQNVVPITRATFYRVEDRLGLKPQGSGEEKRWRKYSSVEADIIKKKIKEEYKFSP